MKCPNCGNNLTIEQSFCAYCGAKNEQAAQHNQNMARYDREFKETQKDVLENSKHFKAFTVKCTIMAVLACLIAVVIMGLQNRYEIQRYFEEKDIIRHQEEHAQKLKEYEEERNYIEIREYMTANRLEYGDTFMEYNSIYNATSAYHTYMVYLGFLLDEDSYSTLEDSECIANISSSINRIQKTTVDDSYKQKFGMLEEPHISFINDMKLEIQSVTQAYFNLTDEEAEGIWEMSDARRTVMLEEGYNNAGK